MTIRLGWLSEDWLYAAEGAEITFSAVRERIVKMDVRVEARTNLFVTDTNDEPHFLCTVDTMESIEFNARSAFTLYGDGPIYVRTADSTSVAAPNTDEEIFTRMHDRRPVAPEILEMQKLVHKNMQVMKAQMARDIDGMRRSTERELTRRREALAEAERNAAEAGKKQADNGQPSAKDGGAGGKAEDGKSESPAKK